MSRFDAEHARQLAENAARDAANFTVGATVYRHHFGLIEQGTVVTVGRCDDEDRGEKANGRFPYYVADFVRSPGCSAHWMAQSHSWRFVATREEAAAQLADYLRQQIEEKKREIDALDKKLAAVQRGEIVVLLEGNAVPAPGRPLHEGQQIL